MYYRIFFKYFEGEKIKWSLEQEIKYNANSKFLIISLKFVNTPFF